MLQGWRLTVSKFFLIPQRYILGLMGFLAIVNAYTMRVSLSIAITEMVAHKNSTEHYDPDACFPEDSDSGGSVTNVDKLYDWDEKTQGLILSSFYWGYVVTHLPGGILAEKLGGKYTLGLGIMSTAFFTLITPYVITSTNGNWKILVILRVMAGLGEGTTYPALNALLSQWVPLSERARIGTLVYAGGQIGTIITNLISGSLIKHTEDWASVFYLFGSIGMVWFVIWTLICYSEPEQHPFISDKELEYLRKELGSKSNEKRKTPWKAILTSVPVWALVAAQVGHDWGFFTMVTDLPKYMKDVLKFDVESNGIWSSVPYIVMWIVSMVFGWVCDWMITKKIIGVTFARKIFTSVASVGPAVFIIVASYSGCDKMLAVWMFTIAMGFMGTFYCGMKVNALDLSSNYAGTLMAIVNGIGAITGIITPYLAGALTPNNVDKLYDWDKKTQGLLSSFYWGYAITHLPEGILAEKLGRKYTLGLGIISTAFFTLITPYIITSTDGNWKILVILRVMAGLGEVTTYPALNALLSQWVPLSERARIGTLVYAGGQIGTIITNLISGSLIKHTEDWASVFYLFGSIGMVWFVIWTLICYSRTRTKSLYFRQKREYLRKELGNKSNEKRKTPWKAILTSVPVWALVAAQVGHDWGFFTMVTDLPKYIKDFLKFDVESNGIWSSVPYIVMWIVSMVFGWVCDWMITKKIIGVTFARKIFTSVASVGPAVFIIVASYSGCDKMLAVWMFTIAMGFMGTFYCGMKVNALDLSSNCAGTLMVIMNGIGAITGIITPYLAGALTPNNVDKLYDWDKKTQGLILSSFYWGYAITHLPGGILAEKLGGKYTLGLGIISTAFFTLITPYVTTSTDGNWKILVILRVMAGLGEGTTYLALNALLSQWVPLSERARIGTLVYAGGQIGTIITNLISGSFIKHTEDWASVFYLFGSIGMVWFVIWTLICYSRTRTKSLYFRQKREYLRKELGNESNEKRKTPWKAILTSVPVWALVAAQVGHDWGFFTMVTDLPKYIKDFLKFDVESNGIWSSVPYIVMWIVSMVFGWVCDWKITKKIIGVTFAKKIFTSVASVGPAVFIIVASYSGCDKMLAVWMFTIAMGFMGTFYCGMKVNALDLSSNYAGTLMAIVNGIGAITGIITPYLAGALTPNNVDKLYDWDKKTQGLILSSFYWGYAITHLPGGILAEKLRGKYTLGLGIISTAFFTLITPYVITSTDGNWKILVILRVMAGLGEGNTYLALNALLSQWVPLSERARIGTLVYAGGQIGTIITNLISGSFIKHTEDWASVFYLFGSIGMVWFVIWTLICYSRTRTKSLYFRQKREYLRKELGNESNEKRKTPWEAILTSVPVWALVAAQVGHDWGFFTMVTDLPKYIKDFLKFDVESNGIWSSVPYIVMWIVSMVFGWVCDWKITKKIIGVTFAKKIFTSVASVGPAVFIIVASYSGCDKMLAVWMFTIAMGFMGTFYCGMKVNALDLSSNCAGTLMVIVNGIGAITGIITPYLAGALTPNHTLVEWRSVFCVSFAGFNVTNIIYTIWASGEQQWWNDPDNFEGKSRSEPENGEIKKSRVES